jgi:hypothetical protein
MPKSCLMKCLNSSLISPSLKVGHQSSKQKKFRICSSSLDTHSLSEMTPSQLLEHLQQSVSSSKLFTGSTFLLQHIMLRRNNLCSKMKLLNLSLIECFKALIPSSMRSRRNRVMTVTKRLPIKTKT